MLGLAERMNKKSGPGKFYKKTAENISYFNKKLFTIRNKKKIDNNSYYWLKKTQKLINIYSKDSKEMKYFQL